MVIPFEWEDMQEGVADEQAFFGRVKVFGGWLVHTYEWTENGDLCVTCITSTTTFVPDPNHEWKLK